MEKFETCDQCMTPYDCEHRGRCARIMDDNQKSNTPQTDALRSALRRGLVDAEKRAEEYWALCMKLEAALREAKREKDAVGRQSLEIVNNLARERAALLGRAEAAESSLRTAQQELMRLKI